MALAPGTRIGVYEVIESVGVGGMGEVYRARDTTLNRTVALKTLPDEFARDPERLARFAREARTLAQLNHPHIASIYGLETGANPALVMEMVEGETLAARLAAGALALDEALAIARQIAGALEHAHAKGIVHRDLKPANVKVGPRDAPADVKVLDFGLAKAMSPDAAAISIASVVSSPTITSPANMTRAGVILGTAAYMAPEQARGKAVDQRADIWAFGCVLYEMLAGQRAFDGEEITDVLARVIQSEPDWNALPPSTPRPLTTLLQRCLRKDASRRLHAIADVRIDLEEIAAGAPELARDETLPRRRSWWLPALAGAVSGAVLAALASAALMSPRSQAFDIPVMRFSVSMPDGWHLYRTTTSGRLNFAVSPDGAKLLAVLAAKGGTRRVFLRRLDEAAFREVAETDGAQAVFWAPDSRRFGFVTADGVKRGDVDGSASPLMVKLPVLGGASWREDDDIVAGPGGGRPLVHWSAAGGSVAPLPNLPTGFTGYGQPNWLPEGRGLLFFGVRGMGRLSLLALRSGGEARQIDEFEAGVGVGLYTALYRSSQLLVASVDATGRTQLTARPFDAETLQLTGVGATLLSDVNTAFSASDTGVLVYGDAHAVGERFVWHNARGAPGASATERLQPFTFDLSPDERWIAIAKFGGEMVLHDLSRGVTTSLAVRGADPIWSPDGKEIAFAFTDENRRGIRAIPAFGGASRWLYESKEPVYLDDWSRDGRWLVGHLRNNGPGILMPTSSDATPVVFEDRSPLHHVDEARFSPDGRWLAYGYNSAGTGDVFLAAVPPTGERWQVSVSGGAQPRWRADGRALYFLSATGTMMMVDVQTRPGEPPQISTPRALFETGLAVQFGLDQFAVNRDGTRFLLRRPDESDVTSLERLHVIVNWPRLLASQTAPRP